MKIEEEYVVVLHGLVRLEERHRLGPTCRNLWAWGLPAFLQGGRCLLPVDDYRI